MFTVIEKVVNAVESTPEYSLTVSLMLPSTSVLVLVTTTGKMGAMSMSLPMSPPAVTRLEGVGDSNDASDRLALLLCMSSPL